MVSKKSRTVVRENKHRKLRNRFSGTAERPRLAVFRSNLPPAQNHCTHTSASLKSSSSTITLSDA